MYLKFLGDDEEIALLWEPLTDGRPARYLWIGRGDRNVRFGLGLYSSIPQGEIKLVRENETMKEKRGSYVFFCSDMGYFNTVLSFEIMQKLHSTKHLMKSALLGDLLLGNASWD